MCATVLQLTERLDYHCALALLMFSLFVGVARCVASALVVRTVGVLLPLYFVAHVAYLNVVRFDYGEAVAVPVDASTAVLDTPHGRRCVAGFNMAVAVTVGGVNALVWLTRFCRQWRPYSPLIIVFFTALHVFAAFEVR
jgi:hypothetical protein